MEIIAPKLRAVELPIPSYDFIKDRLGCDFVALNFSHAESVQFLSVLDHFLSQTYITQFKNVEHLRLEFPPDTKLNPSYNKFLGYNFTFSLDSYLAKFPKLKQLHATTEHCYVERKIFVQLVDQLSSALKKRPDLKIYCMDIELSCDPNLINQFKRCSKAYASKMREEDVSTLYIMSGEKLSLQLNYYSRLSDNIRETRWIDYNELMDLIRTVGQRPMLEDKSTSEANLALPADFFDRFRNIQTIHVTNQIENSYHFALFVKNCKRLLYLSLSNSQLGQAFFDELPSISSLIMLKVEETSNLNMNFMLRMYQLNDLETNQQLSSRVALKMLQARFHGKLNCKIGDNYVTITRKPRSIDRYLVEAGDITYAYVRKEINFESLVKQCNSLENKTLRRCSIQ